MVKMLIQKHNPESVELCPLANDKDLLQFVIKLLSEVHWTTVSVR